MTYEKVNQKIDVAVVFTREKNVKIKSFSWKNKIYTPERIELMNLAFQGQSAVYSFTLSTQQAAFKLKFNSDRLMWWLDEIYWY